MNIVFKLLVVFVFIIIICFLTLRLCGAFCGNMDKYYYEERDMTEEEQDTLKMLGMTDETDE